MIFKHKKTLIKKSVPIIKVDVAKFAVEPTVYDTKSECVTNASWLHAIVWHVSLPSADLQASLVMAHALNSLTRGRNITATHWYWPENITKSFAIILYCIGPIEQ